MRHNNKKWNDLGIDGYKQQRRSSSTIRTIIWINDIYLNYTTTTTAAAVPVAAVTKTNTRKKASSIAISKIYWIENIFCNRVIQANDYYLPCSGYKPTHTPIFGTAGEVFYGTAQQQTKIVVCLINGPFC